MANEIISITGIEETIKMFREAPSVLVAAGYAKALRAGINVLAVGLEVAAPVRTGKLKASVVTDIAVDVGRRNGIAEVGFGKEGHVANWIEYGHRKVGHEKSGKKLGGVTAPHPFMRAVFDHLADTAITAFVDSLTETVQREYLQNIKGY